MGTLSELLDTLADDPGQRGKQFEHICRWFLTNDPVYRRELHRVWLWREWPGRWGADAGIDLVAEDQSGRLWAIQAKAYDPAYSITKADMDTFLSESGRAEFSFRLLIATTNRLGTTAERTLKAQEKPAGCLLLADLRAARVSWPRSPSDLRPAKLRPKSPQPHQRQAVTAVVRGFETASRGQLIMACGTGKTLTALFISQRLAAKRTLVLVPSLSLLSDGLREWTANAGSEFLPVCSDETVTDSDAAVSSTADLGFPVTTDPTEIAAFLRAGSGSQVVFATYQSSPRIAEAFRISRVPGFDLVIADEAHRCAGRVSSAFATVLDSDAIHARRRLFMTATPRFFTGRVVKEAQEADFEVASMDDESRFGPVFHRLGFTEAIERGLLTDYQVVVVGVDDETYLDWAQRGRFVTIDGTTVTDARTLAGQIGLVKAMKRYDLRRTISFHSRVNRAREFARSIPQLVEWMPARERPKGRLWSHYASGEMSAGVRSMLLDHLRNLDDRERGLLANARCLGEGVDVPALDGVAFIDPRRSEVDIVQAVGRAIRLAENKKVGTIVIPVFIGVGEDPHVALDDSVFKPVWDVIKALRAHDDELGQQLDELRRELGWGRKPQKAPEKIVLDLPARIGTDFLRAFDLHLVDQTTASWEFWFGLLQRFAAQEGHARVLFGKRYEGYHLDKWVNVQRTRYIKRKLPADRVARLESVPGWTWDPIADQWEEGFRSLCQFIERERHARVPTTHVENGYRLGQWVAVQRRVNARARLAPERITRLAALAGWTWDATTDLFPDGLRHLHDYRIEHGNCDITAKYVCEDGFNLGMWVSNRRTDFQKGRLDQHQILALEALPGWSWKPHTDTFIKHLGQIRDFVASHGTARVPDAYVSDDGFRLGAWVVNKRSQFKKGKLPPEQIAALENLPGWTWDALSDIFPNGYRHLEEFVADRRNAWVPDGFVSSDGFTLGTWVSHQRIFFREGTLSASRTASLEAIPGWSWDPHGDAFANGLRHMQDFVAEHGHARISQDYVDKDGFKLGVWVGTQLQHKRQGKLSPRRTAAIEAVSGWTWDPPANRWEEGFSYLGRYVEREGDSRVVITHVEDAFRLGSWVRNQRVRHTRGSLDPDQVARLEALPDWTWDPLADRWEEGFTYLCRYVELKGDCRVPQSYVEDGYRLGWWVTAQRTSYRQGKLDRDRVLRLEAIPGWTWEPRTAS